MKIDLVLIATEELEHQEEFKHKLLKLLFNGIYKNLPWINHIYYLIGPNNLIYENLDLTKVTLVPKESLYSAFPKDLYEKVDFEYFIPQLLELTNAFIVMKDNTFIIEELAITDFFEITTQKPIYSTTLMTTKEPFPKIQEILSNYKKLTSVEKLPTVIQRPIYGIRPYTKELVFKTFRALYRDNLDQKITAEAMYYFGLNEHLAKSSYNIQESLFSFSSAWAGIIKYDLINNPKRQIISITNELNYSYNQIKKLHETAYQWILEGLEQRLN